ncbi:hypothetical protein V6N13_020310 [Hibiscus sabdariffa]
MGPLISYVASDLGIDIDISVADMALDDGGWRWNNFQHLLPYFVLVRIVVICCPQHSLSSDWVSWDGTPDHRFSIKFAYDKRAHAPFGPHDFVWREGNAVADVMTRLCSVDEFAINMFYTPQSFVEQLLLIDVNG